MIAKIIEFSIRNRFLVLLLTLMVIASSVWATFNLSLDAIPDLSDVQVIVVTEYDGQSPEVVDDQVTYPLTTAMLAVPGATVVRGYSMFGLSFVYILFEDDTDIYWARSRVLEYLNFARDRLPAGVQPKLGPDATGVGWVYQYVLFPGYYSPDHPKGLWHDAELDKWYAKLADAPEGRREELVKVRAWEKTGKDPLTGRDLLPANEDLASLRSLQDWYLRYPLSAVEGVSEVAPIGGFVKQYQVVLDPQKMQAYGLSVREVMMAIERSNEDVGGSVIELAENEYMVRSHGYLKGLEDLGKVVVGIDTRRGGAAGEPMAGGMAANAPPASRGVPILLRDVATLQIGGEMRRGVGELDGRGEAVGGVVISRFGANAYQVIQDAKKKLAELEEGLPPGVFIKPTYDRSALIERSIGTLRHTLLIEILVVGIVSILFLLHARSELVAVFVVPSSVLVALLIMHLMGINANIMSLGGIAIAIGVVVDSSIIMVENAHKHLDREEERVHAGQKPRPRGLVILDAAQEVGPALFFSLLIITVSFLPVFVLGQESGRLFKPLAFTKTFAMAAAAVLAITIIPVLMYYFITARVLPAQWGWKRNLAITLAAMFFPAAVLFIIASLYPDLAAYRWWIAGGWALLVGMLLVPQKIIHEEKSPISHFLQWIYNPFFHGTMRHPWLTLGVAAMLLASAIYPATRLGTEFMPPLDEGDLLYMPTTDPSISITKSKELLQQTDKLIATFPEVISVHGKIGRADTATDPAPLSMIETVVQLQTDPAKWRKRNVAYFFSSWPGWLKWPFTHTFWPEARPITTEELKYGWTDPDGTKHQGLNDVVKFPGVANAWPYPIENRLNMLSTGIKTPVGIKIMGPDLKVLSELAERAASAVRTIPGTTSAYPERTYGGYYLDIDVNREAAARYGLTVGEVQDVIQSAIGGMNVTTTVEGLERYPLNVRYARELRDDIPSLLNVLVSTPTGAQIPLGQLLVEKDGERIRINPGPPMIRSENAQRTAWIFVDVAGRDLGSYIKEARQTIAEELELPAGYSIIFSGTFEYWEKTVPRLIAAGVIALVVIVLLLYISSRSCFRVGFILLAVPFSLIGVFWFLWILDYNMSLAVVIGIIALAGLDAETGQVMLLYLDTTFNRYKREGRMRNLRDLYDAIHEGAVKRIRPKTMTVATTFIGLVPLMWAQGTGADVMRRLAAPMIGGLLVSFVMELLVYPVIFYLAKRWDLRREHAIDEPITSRARVATVG
ncbi:MAG TPA: efflux RND transporter permease subunit [Tepidisphaeraceae bacterium]|nr:efflux RND transporter permease subunit [Tepidisphaeraceae bacterium]